MFSDSVWYLIPYTPTDFLFCIHHVVVMLYVVTTLLAGRGAISCVFMLLFGECTSLWQNSWYISETLAGRSKVCSTFPFTLITALLFVTEKEFNTDSHWTVPWVILQD